MHQIVDEAGVKGAKSFALLSYDGMDFYLISTSGGGRVEANMSGPATACKCRWLSATAATRR